MDFQSCISASGLTKKFSKFTLGAIDLEIPKGFATALIGANGAGKTTLIDVLCGVQHKTSGEVAYFGEKGDITDPALRGRISYCASAAFFPQGWTAKDIAISMELANPNFSRAEFAKLCEKLEVDNEFTKKPRAMYKQSDGNRMRTSLAAAFAQKSDLMILDEPGSSLDPLMRDRLCDYMREYLENGEGEKSIIFSTHNIADMENCTDYAVFMDLGKVIECGFVDDLRDKYIIARGDIKDFDRAKGLLMSHSKSRSVFDGLALGVHAEELAAMGVDSEVPTLQQLSIGLLKYAEEIR